MFAPPLAGVLGLTAPTIPGDLLIAGAAIASVLLAEAGHPHRLPHPPRLVLGSRYDVSTGSQAGTFD